MKICIDAGHNYSGVDTGAQGAKSREQDLTFKIADKLQEILVENGHVVKMTRTRRDENVPAANLSESLTYRSNVSNQFGADLFVSVHINAGGGVGAETFSYTASGTAYDYSKKILAAIVSLGRVNRGAKTANFAVLRQTNAPAVLVECGFIDNAAEEVWIMENTDKLAAAIAAGIGVSAPKSDEYISATDSIAVLTERGIISDPEKWYTGTWDDQDFKWLLRKMGTYLK